MSTHADELLPPPPSAAMKPVIFALALTIAAPALAADRDYMTLGVGTKSCGSLKWTPIVRQPEPLLKV
jgi:hypothetical protein